MKKRLNDRQKLFCQEYIKDFNSVQAAIRAGYTEKHALKNSHKMLGKNWIQEKIQELMKETATENKIEASEVLEKISTIAFSKITDFLSVDKCDDEYTTVKIKPSEEWPEEKIGAVSEVRQTKHGISLKLHSAPDMLKVLCQYLGLLKDQVNVKNEVNVNKIDISRFKEEDLREILLAIKKAEEKAVEEEKSAEN